jgi:hypothetical protein
MYWQLLGGVFVSSNSKKKRNANDSRVTIELVIDERVCDLHMYGPVKRVLVILTNLFNADDEVLYLFFDCSLYRGVTCPQVGYSDCWASVWTGGGSSSRKLGWVGGPLFGDMSLCTSGD